MVKKRFLSAQEIIEALEPLLKMNIPQAFPLSHTAVIVKVDLRFNFYD